MVVNRHLLPDGHEHQVRLIPQMPTHGGAGNQTVDYLTPKSTLHAAFPHLCEKNMEEL